MTPASAAFRRRLRRAAAGLVGLWAVLLAGAVAVATGRFGGMGLPTDNEGRPRGLLVVGVAVVAGAAATAVAYRRISGPVGDLLHAAEHVGRGDGEVAVVEVPDVAVRGPRELRLLTATFNDMRSRLAASQEQRRRFLADITHELRNPLAVLQSEIEALLDGVHPRDDRHLASLLDETRRLGLLIEDLHTLALAESGQLGVSLETVQLADLVDEVVSRHAAGAVLHEVSLQVCGPPDLPKVAVDPARLRQVLDNLLTNAVRHSPPGGRVTVVLTSDGDTVACTVTDCGPGFPDGRLDAVFDRFTRAGDSSGSGLGLSIARDLVDAHRGTITAANDPVTGGAQVVVTLPVDDPS